MDGKHMWEGGMRPGQQRWINQDARETYTVGPLVWLDLCRKQQKKFFFFLTTEVLAMFSWIKFLSRRYMILSLNHLPVWVPLKISSFQMGSQWLQRFVGDVSWEVFSFDVDEICVCICFCQEKTMILLTCNNFINFESSTSMCSHPGMDSRLHFQILASLCN